MYHGYFLKFNLLSTRDLSNQNINLKTLYGLEDTMKNIMITVSIKYDIL